MRNKLYPLILLLVCSFGAFAGVYNNSPTLPGSKVDAHTATTPANQTITASEFNNLVQGVADLRTDSQSGKVFDVRAYGADPTGVGDSTTAFQSAVTAAETSSGMVFVPKGTFKLTAPIVIIGNGVTIKGTGYGSTVIDFEPLADGAAFYFGNSSDHSTQYFNNTIEGLSFQSSDTGHKKIAIQTHSQGSFRAFNIQTISSEWSGHSSEGINLQNIQAGLALLDRVQIYADVGIHLSADTLAGANVSDHVHIHDSYLVTTQNSAGQCVLIDDIRIQDLTIDGDNAWVVGKYGLYWNAPTETGSSYNVRISNIRTEQTVTPAVGNVVYMNVAASEVHNFTFSHIWFDSNSNGLYLTSSGSGLFLGVEFDQIMQGGVAGFMSPTPSTIDVTARLAIFRDIELQQSSQINTHSMVQMFATPLWDTYGRSMEVWIDPSFVAPTYASEFLAGLSSGNQLDLQGNISGSPPLIGAKGSDTNINIGIVPKGSGVVNLGANSSNGANVEGNMAVGAGFANSITLNGSGTGVALQISAQGTDTDINLSLSPKGAGVLNTSTTSNIDSHGKINEENGSSVGSPGNAVINKVSGLFQIANGASAAIITNSRLSTSSIPKCWLQSTGAGVANVICVNNGNGTFTATSVNGTGVITNTSANAQVAFELVN